MRPSRDRTLSEGAAGDLPESSLLDALDVCLEHGALEETPEGYRFSHPLKREVMYDRLSHARRTALHGCVATALERVHAGYLEDHAEVLAHHWTMSEHPGRAVPYLVQAGDRAAAVFANEVAITTYSSVFDLLDSPDLLPASILRRLLGTEYFLRVSPSLASEPDFLQMSVEEVGQEEAA